MVGLPSVRVIAYTPEWMRLFEEEQSRLQCVIGDHVLEIRHIGSTSVPGLPAKPIIDIGIAVTSFEEAACCIQPLVALGYTYRGENGIPRRHYFSREEPNRYHLHMNEIQSRDWIQTTGFRDYLLRHPETAAEYGELKQRLAEQYSTDIRAYSAGKDAFIQDVLRAGLAKAGEP